MQSKVIKRIFMLLIVLLIKLYQVMIYKLNYMSKNITQHLYKSFLNPKRLIKL